MAPRVSAQRPVNDLIRPALALLDFTSLTESGVLVDRVNEHCKTYAVMGREPVLALFPYGEGQVVYTSFHNDPSASENVVRVVQCMILQTISLAVDTPLVGLAEMTNLPMPYAPRR